jgi:hypothetical protein
MTKEMLEKELNRSAKWKVSRVQGHQWAMEQRQTQQLTARMKQKRKRDHCDSTDR